MQAGDLTGKSSLFGGFAKAIRGRRADKSVGKNDETLEASAFDATLDAPAFESDLAAIEPITREEPELETTPSLALRAKACRTSIRL